ncbi:MAG: pyridoxamine 5'-phosphate oxidase family protein [Pseudomonadota bacterium]
MSITDDPDLEIAEQWVLAQLTRAGSDLKSPMRWPVMCTTDIAGRVIVLRRFEAETREAIFFTDRRARKVSAIQHTPHAEIVFFDPKRMLQIRTSGSVRLEVGGQAWRADFAKLPERSLADYSTIDAPGCAMEHPEPRRDLSLAEQNFARLIVKADRIDCLELSRQGHRRAVFDWRSGEPVREWVAP